MQYRVAANLFVTLWICILNLLNLYSFLHFISVGCFMEERSSQETCMFCLKEIIPTWPAWASQLTRTFTLSKQFQWWEKTAFLLNIYFWKRGGQMIQWETYRQVIFPLISLFIFLPVCSLFQTFSVPSISLFGLECFEGREVTIDTRISNMQEEGFNTHFLSVRVNSGWWVCSVAYIFGSN